MTRAERRRHDAEESKALKKFVKKLKGTSSEELLLGLKGALEQNGWTEEDLDRASEMLANRKI
jgi:NADH:ubiquinone oxidoreductase subunit E